ncbi:hypothetical protein BZA05DRAFT_388561 [Tricharina praecox]|uniref:uncharacterized protein n=1 Tax=Tricharina praecox TaxID=43433 RepID=UPI0022202BC2|nr:uncharacterized protein BZA05DRAFT_388561 [Tricharina praecox]KAI5856456.1 hypothetical protein BZA05DRAFT_388561 [Tricharina praecox]
MTGARAREGARPEIWGNLAPACLLASLPACLLHTVRGTYISVHRGIGIKTKTINGDGWLAAGSGLPERAKCCLF